jgi:hypothetical protein
MDHRDTEATKTEGEKASASDIDLCRRAFVSAPKKERERTTDEHRFTQINQKLVDLYLCPSVFICGSLFIRSGRSATS